MTTANQFLAQSEEDLDNSLFLYQNEKYPLAIFCLQQAVEKALKAVNLATMGTRLNPKELKTHFAYKLTHRYLDELGSTNLFNLDKRIAQGLSTSITIGNKTIDYKFNQERIGQFNKDFANGEDRNYTNISLKELDEFIRELEEPIEPIAGDELIDIMQKMIESGSNWMIDDQTINEMQQIFEIPSMGDVFVERGVRLMEGLMNYQWAQMILAKISLLTSGHNQSTRYPENGVVYNLDQPLVREFKRLYQLVETAIIPLRKGNVFIPNMKFKD